jgi:tetratricopeptide (TPR) repeat protein
MLGIDAGVREDHDRSVALFADLVAQSPTDAELTRSLAVAIAERGDAIGQRGDFDGASTDFARAAELLTALRTADASDPQTAQNLLAAMANHALLLARRGEHAAAAALVERATALLPENAGPETERSRIELLTQAGDLALRMGDAEQALQHLEAASERVARFVGDDDEPSRRLTAANVALNHGIALMVAGQPDAALAKWREAVPKVRSAAGTKLGRLLLGTLLLRICDAHVRAERADDARASFAEAMQAGITGADVADLDPLPRLFSRPEFHDLLPKDPR